MYHNYSIVYKTPYFTFVINGKDPFLTRCISAWLSHCRQGGRVGEGADDGGEELGGGAASGSDVDFSDEAAAASTGRLLFFCWADRVGCTL